MRWGAEGKLIRKLIRKVEDTMEAQDVREREFQRVYAQIDLDAIRENVVHIIEHMDPCTKIMAVIKADGYGHGSVPIAMCIDAFENIYGYAVASVEEALILRREGITKPVLILGYTFPYSYEQLIREEIRITVFREDTLAQLSQAAVNAGRCAKIHIKVDTGMNRIGITPDDSGISLIRKAMKTPGVEIEGIFTHFAKADETDKSGARKQLAAFRGFLQRIEEELMLQIPIRHCANSACVIELPDAQMDMVRPGIILYGLWPSDEVSQKIVKLRPALSLHSHVVYVKDLHKGQSVSYGGTFTASREMRIATIPVGYGDGYPRMLSGKGYVLIKGQKAPIVGRVCMDQFMVDVTKIVDVTEGDPVTLIGTDGSERITAELLGELSGRFNYELVCDLGRRIPRVYVCDGRIASVRAPYEMWGSLKDQSTEQM